jgi:hypothetical protein
MGHWSPSTSGTASRRSNLYQMPNNGHSVILKNVGINLFCSGTWNMFRGELGFEFSALCGMAAKAGPLAQREEQCVFTIPCKLACEGIWKHGASLACQAQACDPVCIRVNQCNRWLNTNWSRQRSVGRGNPATAPRHRIRRGHLWASTGSNNWAVHSRFGNDCQSG